MIYSVQASSESTAAQAPHIFLQILFQQAKTPTFVHAVSLNFNKTCSQFLRFDILIFGIAVLKRQTMTCVLDVRPLPNVR